MASVTIYRFRLELTDVDRGVYESLDFRTALHPSESPVYLITRVLAYALNAQTDLLFSPGGLSDPDAPALRVDDMAGGGTSLWIEIGNPSARKLHKAAKSSDRVKVYTYKDPELLLKELSGATIHRASEIEIMSFDPRFLERLAAGLQKDNPWNVMMSHGELLVSFPDGRAEQSSPRTHQIPPKG